MGRELQEHSISTTAAAARLIGWTGALVVAVLMGALLGPAPANADLDCANPPSTADLRVARGVQGFPVTIDAPSGYYPGCDLVGDPITATFDWGDGRQSGGTFIPGKGTLFSIQGSHAYAKPGYYRIVITQTNNRTGVTRQDTHYNAAIRPSVLRLETPLRSTVGQSFQGRLARVPVPITLSTKYKATISWGDGSNSKARLKVKRSKVSVFGRHIWTDSIRGGRIVITIRALETNARVRVIRPLVVRAGS